MRLHLPHRDSKTYPLLWSLFLCFLSLLLFFSLLFTCMCRRTHTLHTHPVCSGFRPSLLWKNKAICLCFLQMKAQLCDGPFTPGTDAAAPPCFFKSMNYFEIFLVYYSSSMVYVSFPNLFVSSFCDNHHDNITFQSHRCLMSIPACMRAESKGRSRNRLERKDSHRVSSASNMHVIGFGAYKTASSGR